MKERDLDRIAASLERIAYLLEQMVYPADLRIYPKDPRILLLGRRASPSLRMAAVKPVLATTSTTEVESDGRQATGVHPWWV